MGPKSTELDGPWFRRGAEGMLKGKGEGDDFDVLPDSSSKPFSP